MQSAVAFKYSASLSFRFQSKFILVFAFALMVINSFGQVAEFNVVAAFDSLSSEPSLIHFKNNKPIPGGGHVQGVQSYSQNGNNFMLLTGSSSNSAYYALIDLSQQKLLDVKKLSNKPFRHAGGCQVTNNKLFVGIEDNMAKDKSFIARVELASSKVDTIIKRSGTFKRSTAGATAAVLLPSGKYLVAVGDWDSRNIDFYISDNGDNKFDSLGTFHAPNNQKWCAYQSINLLSSGNKLFLIGFGLDGLNNRADLFEVDIENRPPDLHLIRSRNFNCSAGTSFRYGAGFAVTGNHLFIYATRLKIRAANVIAVFK